MDFNYTFKQAHQDRLEDAGFKKYRPQDGFRVNNGKAQGVEQKPSQRRFRTALAAIAQGILMPGITK